LKDFGALLRTTLIKAGLRRWLRGRFSPHMTLSYAAEDLTELPVDPVAWTVRDFVLVESLQGLHTHIQRGVWDLPADGNRPS
jgi:2'-5' RNA ligase